MEFLPAMQAILLIPIHFCLACSIGQSVTFVQPAYAQIPLC